MRGRQLDLPKNEGVYFGQGKSGGVYLGEEKMGGGHYEEKSPLFFAPS